MRGAGSVFVDARRLDLDDATGPARGMTMKKDNDTVFIGGDIYRQAAYGNNHPLTIPRVGPVMDVCRHMGWLDDDAYVESPQASREDLIRFHASAYVDAVIEVDQAGKSNAQLRESFGLGTQENPVFTGLANGRRLAAADQFTLRNGSMSCAIIRLAHKSAEG